MPGQSPAQQQREEETQLAVHIVGVAAALVGVCLTVIGLIQIWLHLRPGVTTADNILAADAVVFLCACVLAYASLRSRSGTRRRTLERMADACFLFALLLMTLVCGALAFELM